MTVTEGDLRILMVGGGAAYHLEPLARCIKKADPHCRLEVHGLFTMQPDGTRIYLERSTYFDRVHQLKQWKSLPVRANGNIRPNPAPKAPEMRPFWFSFARFSYHILRMWRESIRWKRHFARLLPGVDLVHLQGMFLGPAHYWLLFDRKKPVVVSCWGSDIFRQAEVPCTFAQKRLFESAAAITITGIEFQETVLAKYGRHLKPKIVHTYFNPGVEVVLEYTSDCLRRRFAPGKNSWRVCLGHSGFEAGNHRALVESMARLPSDLKRRIELVIPMTYGAPVGYCNEIHCLAENSGCQFEILQQYMTDAEVVELRKSTDILVFAPISDAFSASVSQAFAAGTVVVSGAWLPYKARILSGFKYHEIFVPEAAGTCVQNVIKNWAAEQTSLSENRLLAAQVFSEKAIGAAWVETYHNVAKSLSEKSERGRQP